MEKRIELEKRGRNPDTIKDLNLDNCRSSNIVGLDDSFVNLEVLSMINIGLTSLKGFPKLPNLKRLELSDNRIQSGLENLKESPKLEYLNLCGNRLKDLETLEPLKELKHLSTLDLFNCEVTEEPNYRTFVFELIPNLKYLDGYDQNNKEVEDDEEDDVEEGDFDGEDNESENGENGIADEDDDDDEEGDEDDDDAEDESDFDDEDEEEDVGLRVLVQDKIDEEDENDDFVPDEEEDDDEALLDEEEALLDEESDAQTSAKGEKRKTLDEADESTN